MRVANLISREALPCCLIYINIIIEVTMFEISDPRSWMYFTNWLLVIVAVVAAGYIGFRLFRERRVKSATAAEDAHTLVLPDLGITMADGGEKIADTKPADRK
jgi:hypothetical protein